MVEIKKADEQISYWGATEKKCPICAETIPMVVLECPFCKATFDDVRPLTREDVLGSSEEIRTAGQTVQALLWMSWVIAALYIVLVSLGAMLFLVHSS
jgi:hypothetical protein